MKSLMLLLFVSLPFFAFSQVEDTIPKKANSIEIITGFDLDKNFELATQAAIEKDWTIGQVHKELGIFTAEAVIGSIAYKFKFSAQKDKIRLTGDYEIQGVNLGVSKIQNIGQKGSPAKKAFQSMLSLAQKLAELSGGKLSFFVI